LQKPFVVHSSPEAQHALAGAEGSHTLSPPPSDDPSGR
jgi:hypothetical protein